MAKPTYKFPFSSILGKFGAVDASRGRDPGIAAELLTQKGVPIFRAPVARTNPTSSAVHAQSKIYCDCDELWKYISDPRRLHLVLWWKWARGRQPAPLPAYQTFMQACMSNAPEIFLFCQYCWVGRYHLVNNTFYDYPEQEILLTGIPYAVPFGNDNQVWTLLPNSHLGEQVSRSVITPGSVSITVPPTPVGASRWWDVYAQEVPYNAHI